MSGLSTAVAVARHRLGAVDGHVAGVAAAVTLDLGAILPDMAVFTARVALLLFLTVTIASQVAQSATRVTALVSRVLGLHTVFGDVASSPAVVADVLGKVTVLSMMTRFTAAVTVVGQGGGTALPVSAEASSSAPSTSRPSRAAPGPVGRAPAAEILLTAHGRSGIFQ